MKDDLTCVPVTHPRRIAFTMETSNIAFMHHSIAIGFTLIVLAGSGCSDGDSTPREPNSVSVHPDNVMASKYDASTHILTIRLARGIYRFADVPEKVAQAFDQAGDAQSSAYNSMIKGNYKATYVPPTQADYSKPGL